jgi:hypothetical protein
MTPFQIFLRKKPNLSKIRIFGNVTYVHIPIEKEPNFSQRHKNVYWWAMMKKPRDIVVMI